MRRIGSINEPTTPTTRWDTVCKEGHDSPLRICKREYDHDTPGKDIKYGPSAEESSKRVFCTALSPIVTTQKPGEGALPC